MWALVHSPDPAHVERGLELAQSMIKSRDIDQQHLNDLVYMCAVVSSPFETSLLAAVKGPLAMCFTCLLCTGTVSQRELPGCKSSDC